MQKIAIHSYGNLEKLPFRPISSLLKEFLSSEYQLYACEKNPLSASILDEKSNFLMLPYECLNLNNNQKKLLLVSKKAPRRPTIVEKQTKSLEEMRKAF